MTYLTRLVAALVVAASLVAAPARAQYPDPCMTPVAVKQSVAVNITGATTTQLIAAVQGQASKCGAEGDLDAGRTSPSCTARRGGRAEVIVYWS
jgi:hypothetical protein